MRVLLTGATGFIGAAVARALLAQGHELTCAVREPARLDLGRGPWKALQVDLAGVPGRDWWRPHLAGIDAVVSATGILRESPGQTFEALHARAPAELFLASADAGVKTVVHVSALGADEQAFTPYQRTKKKADDVLRGLPLSGAIVQPSVVYGRSDAAAMFNRMAAAPLLLMPQAGGMRVQPVLVDDVVDGILAVLAAPPRPVATIAFVGPQPLTLAQYLRQLRAALGLRGSLPVLPMPTFVFMLAARVAARVPGSPLDADTAAMLLHGNTAPVDDFQRLLGRAPREVDRFIPAGDAPQRRAEALRGVRQMALGGLVAAGAVAVAVAALLLRAK